MEGLTLPIDVLPGSNPPIFRWSQVVGTPNGKVVVKHEASLPPSVEVAVERIISIAKQALMDNAALQGTVKGLSDRIADQSELPTKRAEKSDAPQAVPAGPAAPAHTSKGKR